MDGRQSKKIFNEPIGKAIIPIFNSPLAKRCHIMWQVIFHHKLTPLLPEKTGSALLAFLPLFLSISGSISEKKNAQSFNCDFYPHPAFASASMPICL